MTFTTYTMAIYSRILILRKNGFSRREELFLLEKKIEQKLEKAVKVQGGLALKFVSPNFDGMPDRIILLPEGKMAFVEVKANGKKPRNLQISRHRILRKRGFQVFILDDEKQIEKIIDEIERGDSS